jgi:hypothetical protein
MDRNELIKRINEEGEFLVQYFDSKPKEISALIAVIKLHRPDGDLCKECAHGGYPCQTILAIERELA